MMNLTGGRKKFLRDGGEAVFKISLGKGSR